MDGAAVRDPPRSAPEQTAPPDEAATWMHSWQLLLAHCVFFCFLPQSAVTSFLNIASQMHAARSGIHAGQGCLATVASSCVASLVPGRRRSSAAR